MKKSRIIYTEDFLGMLMVEIVEKHRNSVVYDNNNRIVNKHKEKGKKETLVVILSFKLEDQEDNQMLVLEFNTKEVPASGCIEISEEISKICKNLEIKIKTA